MKISFVILSCLSAGALFANPENPTIIEGDVSFSGTSSLVVTSETNRSIVEWESFSIGAMESTEFVLPNAGSAILNRVTVENISDLYGTLTSNGEVYLINPYGIYIHDGALVSASAFLASTLDGSNEEFLAGDEMTFTGTDNADIVVSNNGTIETSFGDVTLLGFKVIQGGSISSEGGGVNLGAGMEMVFRHNNDPRITIVAGSGTPTDIGVDIAGQINAVFSEIKADGNLYQYAINLDGAAEIDLAAPSGSFATLESVDGYIYVNAPISSNNDSGLSGGVINVLGETVEISDSGVLDASGFTLGGEIYVGGGWGGIDPDRFNAVTTTITSDALLDCGAGLTGDGGTAVVWADNTATFYGTIDASAGLFGGDGGTVEVSGIQTLNFFGTVDVSSLFGNDGSLVIDPRTLIYQPTDRAGYIQAHPIIK